MKRLYYIPTAQPNSPTHYYSYLEDRSGGFYSMRSGGHAYNGEGDAPHVVDSASYRLIPVCKLRRIWPKKVITEYNP